MRMSQEEKEKSRGRIVASASRLLRERGLAGASVGDVMKAAGMTHGGFYKHFDRLSRPIARAICQTVTRTIRALAAPSPPSGRRLAARPMA